ncbi:MAG: hypothetical protein IJY73_03090 [Oscillospiraceae bacterium]|nr:hypothetical protein [Oscillospiraceae bacterium]
MSFFVYGLVIVLIILVPNVVFALYNKDGFENLWHNKAVEILEQVGRFGCMIFMFIVIPEVSFPSDESFALYIIVNMVLLLLYCLLWIVFFRKNNMAKAVSLSVIPSVIFLFSGIISLNIPLIITAVIFAPCHILISVKNVTEKEKTE